mmetsp:Transcript_16581/g.64737  ORF Transcript_16581/g.64737 Transcript_16581/m.64737 type:complete len:236 (-) Transcript_16581:179-886(-)
MPSSFDTNALPWARSRSALQSAHTELRLSSSPTVSWNLGRKGRATSRSSPFFSALLEAPTKTEARAAPASTLLDAPTKTEARGLEEASTRRLLATCMDALAAACVRTAVGEPLAPELLGEPGGGPEGEESDGEPESEEETDDTEAEAERAGVSKSSCRRWPPAACRAATHSSISSALSARIVWRSVGDCSWKACLLPFSAIGAHCVRKSPICFAPLLSLGDFWWTSTLKEGLSSK